ncbi:MAG: hypothetical protein CO017_09680, partial [Zetaproteobacteria bacterium CG_4_8_14_3_um_filter_59_5]
MYIQFSLSVSVLRVQIFEKAQDRAVNIISNGGAMRNALIYRCFSAFPVGFRLNNMQCRLIFQRMTSYSIAA